MMWLFYSLITIICWGFWGVMLKMALNHISWQQSTIISTSVSVPVCLLIYIYYKPSISLSSPGFYPALAVGLINSIALVSNYLAIGLGKLSVVTPLIALYPLVTIALSIYVLNENITLTQGLGIVFAAIAIVLFSV